MKIFMYPDLRPYVLPTKADTMHRLEQPKCQPFRPCGRAQRGVLCFSVPCALGRLNARQCSYDEKATAHANTVGS